MIVLHFFFFFFFKQKTAYEIMPSLVGSEMCIRDREYKTLKSSKPTPAYDIAADPQNNLFGAGRTSKYVWREDAKTGEISYYDIPDKPRGVGGLGGGMRRGITDAKGRLWWGGFDGNFVGMLDPSLPKGTE